MGNPKTFWLPVIADRTFKDAIVAMDNRRYERCRFENCILMYSGGSGEAFDCYFAAENVGGIQGAARTVLDTLQAYGWRIEYGLEPRPVPPRVRDDVP